MAFLKFNLILLEGLGATPGFADCLGIIPGGVQGIIYNARDRAWVDYVKGCCLNFCKISLHNPQLSKDKLWNFYLYNTKLVEFG